jgi:superfamily II DNA or RNA helicase
MYQPAKNNMSDLAFEHSRWGVRIPRDHPRAQEVRDALMVAPKMPTAFGRPQSFEAYTESDKFLYIPRHFPIGKLLRAARLAETLPDPSVQPPDPAVWQGQGLRLRDAQVPVSRAVRDALDRHGGALLSVPCGFGKTIMSVHLMSQLRVRTLVIVHKTFLMDQFTETISRFFPDVRIGYIRGATAPQDMEDRHVVIGMLQTLSSARRRLPAQWSTMFDLVVCDECHHIGARVFSRAMLRFPARFTLGLSATPERKDGLGRVVRWFVGRTIVTAPTVARPTCQVSIHRFVHPPSCDCPYGTERRQNYGAFAPLLPCMVSDMAACPARTRFICDLVRDILTADPGRNVLIVSDRIQHLHDMRDLLQSPQLRIGLYIGCMKQTDRDRVASDCNVILGTYALTREGLDIRKLDTLVVATPTGDIVQTAGRIMRCRETAESSRRIIDICDDYSVFPRLADKRMKYYASQSFERHEERQQQEELPVRQETYGFIDDA